MGDGRAAAAPGAAGCDRVLGAGGAAPAQVRADHDPAVPRHAVQRDQDAQPAGARDPGGGRLAGECRRARI